MSAFKAGQAKPSGSGRKKGTPNKKSDRLEVFLQESEIHIPEMIFKLLPKLSPEKQMDTLIDLMGYVYPKRKAIEIADVVDNNPPQVILTLPSNGREVKLPRDS